MADLDPAVLDRLRNTLKTGGPGHNLEQLHALGLGPDVRIHLLELQRRGEAARVGAYWWLKVREPRSYPKPAPPPPAKPIKAALAHAGIQEESGHAVRRIPRRKVS